MGVRGPVNKVITVPGGKEFKKCSICGQLKPVLEFSVRNKTGKLRSDCKECNRATARRRYASDPERYSREARESRQRHRPTYRRYFLKSAYGLTEAQVDAMLSDQNGRCAICQTDKFGGPGKRPHIDHNRITGKIRGLLCQQCNTALGLAQHSSERLRQMALYLERND